MDYYKVNENGKKFVLSDIQGNFFDPWESIKPITAQDKNRGRAYWEFTNVSDNVYDLYVTFIKTGRAVLRREAERAHRYG